MKISIKLLLFTFVFPYTLKAQVFVNQNAAGANNGSSWLNAFTNLDTAISKTAAGDIWIAKGNYKPSVIFSGSTGAVKAFAINKKIALYGGFNGVETTFSQRDISKNITFLSGDIGVEGNISDNTPTVLKIYGAEVDSTTVIDGFTIKGAYYSDGNSFDYENAALMISGNGLSTNPIIRNCIIRDNYGFSGAAIWVRNAMPLITNNDIINNTAFEGAGIYCADHLANPQIIRNRISNNRCVGNYSHLAGGAIKVATYCNPYIYGNLIENNYADLGGAIYNESNYNIGIVNNIISNNAGKNGGAIYGNGYGTKLIGNLIAGNTAEISGGAIYLDYTTVELTNNTITGNSCIENGGAFYIYNAKLLATNNIIYSNSSKLYKPVFINTSTQNSMPRFNYNNMENGINSIQFIDTTLQDSVWQQGNISQYPEFADTLNYNFQ